MMHDFMLTVCTSKYHIFTLFQGISHGKHRVIIDSINFLLGTIGYQPISTPQSTHSFTIFFCIISLPASTYAVLTTGVIRIKVAAFQADSGPKGPITLTCEYIDTSDAACALCTTAFGAHARASRSPVSRVLVPYGSFVPRAELAVY